MRALKKGHSVLSFHGNFQLPDGFNGSLADAFQLLVYHLQDDSSEFSRLNDENHHDPSDGFDEAYLAYLWEDNCKFTGCIGVDVWDGEEWIKLDNK